MRWSIVWKVVFVLVLIGEFAPVMAEGKEKTDGGGTAAFDQVVSKLETVYGLRENQHFLLVDISEQRLYLLRGDGTQVSSYPVSTSKFGVGNRAGSNKTPLGTHAVKEKYGKGAALGTIFKARRNTGRIAEIHTDNTDLEEDLITTRILRLEGLENGKNRGPGIDSYERTIYIHGTPEEGLIGRPASHGCIRMRNGDVVNLFNRVPVGTLVEIRE